jgi:hypothetical protein
LRCAGAFYGLGIGMLDAALGGGVGRRSFRQIDDVAEATALAVELGRSVCNIVDDRSAPGYERLSATTAMLGANPLFRGRHDLLLANRRDLTRPFTAKRDSLERWAVTREAEIGEGPNTGFTS